MIVRALEPADHRGWSAMRQQLWPEAGRDDAGDLARMHVPAVVMVADDGERLIGFAEATIRSVVDGLYFRPGGFLEGIWVAPKARRTGVATALLGGVTRWVRERGANAMGSDAMPDNRASIAWHKKHGFEIEAEVIKFVRELD